MQSRWKKAVPGALALLLCAGLLVRTVVQLARSPELNWDMLPAMALALEWEVRDPVELHRRTYALAREELAPAEFQALCAPGVREIRARDPQAFHEHLPFYRARVLYSLAMYVLHRLGAPLSAATYWVPIGAYALGALLFFLWSRAHLATPLAALFALGLAHTPAFLNQAGTSSADGLATLLLVIAGWLWLERRSFAGCAALATLAIGARPDTVILVGFLAAAMFLCLPRAERPSLRALGIWLGLSGLLYLGLHAYAGEYGWWPLIQISFNGKSPHPAQLPTEVDWGEYGAILARQFASLPGEGYVQTPNGEVTGSTLALFYGALALVGVVLAWPAQRGERRLVALFAALLGAYLLRFLLFPQLWDRFLAPVYALVPLGGLAALSRALRRPASEVAA